MAALAVAAGPPVAAEEAASREGGAAVVAVVAVVAAAAVAAAAMAAAAVAAVAAASAASVAAAAAAAADTAGSAVNLDVAAGAGVGSPASVLHSAPAQHSLALTNAPPAPTAAGWCAALRSVKGKTEVSGWSCYQWRVGIERKGECNACGAGSGSGGVRGSATDV